MNKYIYAYVAVAAGIIFIFFSGAMINKLDYRDQPKGMLALQRGDVSAAALAFQKGTADGDPEAMFQLALLYQAGKGVPKNPAQAVRLYESASDLNYPPAMMNLAHHYFTGDGVRQNYSKYAVIYQELVSINYKPARLPLALIYADGLGVQQDESKAAKLLLQLASEGDPQGQSMLGLMYLHGRGVAKDRVEALALWESAAAQGDIYAAQNKTMLSAQLTTNEIAAANDRYKKYTKHARNNQDGEESGASQSGRAQQINKVLH